MIEWEKGLHIYIRRQHDGDGYFVWLAVTLSPDVYGYRYRLIDGEFERVGGAVGDRMQEFSSMPRAMDVAVRLLMRKGFRVDKDGNVFPDVITGYLAAKTIREVREEA